MTDIQWGIGIEHETLIIQPSNHKIMGQDLLENLGQNEFNLRYYIQQLIEPNCQYAITNPVYISPSELKSYYTNHELSHLLLKLLKEYQKIYPSEQTLPELLQKLLEETHEDGTNTFSADEFVTIHWKNQTIQRSVREITLFQWIILESIRGKNGTPVHLSAFGSGFPLVYESKKYIIDYTGSYHLNLSLPYSLTMMKTEEQLYRRRKNKIQKTFDTYLSEHRANNIEFYLNTPNMIEQLNTLLTPVYQEPIPPKILQNGTREWKSILTKYDNNHFRQFIRNREKFMENMVFMFILSKSKLQKDNLYLYYLDANNFITEITRIKSRRIVKEKDNPILPFYKMIVESLLFDDSIEGGIVFRLKPFTVFRLDKKGTTEMKLSPKLNFETIISQQKPIPTEISDRFRKACLSMVDDDIKKVSYISSLVYSNLVDKFRNSVGITLVQPLNHLYNMRLKYQSSYHRLHHRWAIGIQWILPLLLSCFSSCDPLSITGSPKLSQLSLRLFISGYSFINFVNIMENYLPLNRVLSNWEYTANSLLPKLAEEFAYKPFKTSSGTEFRVDPSKGYQFGFEIRIFDNFPTEHLGTLLEFLFLLSDHLESQHLSLNDNPFNHPVVNETIMLILHRGWHTIIPSNYIELLREVLEIPLISGRTAYQTCDDIYLYLQHRYIRRGRGIGPFGRYVIRRSKTTKHLPNINRESWYHHFIRLIWKPDTLRRRQLVQCLGQPNFLECLRQSWGPDVENILPDIEYALDKLYLV